MATAFLILLAYLGAVLIISGLAKVRSADTTAELEQLGVPRVLRHPALLAIHPYAEIVLGLGLLATGGWLLVAFALASTALMGFYTVIVARAVRTGSAESCNCFGALFNPHLTWRSVARNVTLVALSVAAAAGALAGYSAPAIVSDTPGSLLAVLASGVVAALTWLIVSGPAADGGDGGAGDGVGLEGVGLDDAELGDYVRLPIPYAWVETADGSRATLRELAATKARLLVFLSPTCGACAALAESIPGWIEEFEMLGVHPIYYSARDSATAAFPELEQPALYESEMEVSRSFGVRAYPSAVLLGMDGLLAGGPVLGKDEINGLVDSMREELAAADEPEDVPADGEGSR